MLKVNELFSGIGSQNSALKRLAIDYEITTTSDLDTHAIISYAAIHCELMEKLKDYDFPSGEEMADYLLERNIGWNFKNNKPYNWKRFIDKITGKGKKGLKKAYLATVLSNNAGDISKIDKLDYADFWTYSFPCQDISVAGKQAGIEKHTRSGLLYEVERLLRVSAEHGELPKYLMLENVKNLVGKKFKAQFDEWLEYLDELGYNTYWQVLNAKNYGIPQNRERVFAISIRKDIDTGDFSFPEGFDNGLRLKDFLEDEVDEKFYISQEKTDKLISQLVEKNQEISYCIDANYWKGTTPEQFLSKSRRQLVAIPCITPDREEKRQNGRRFKEDGDPMFTLTGQDRHGVLQVGNIVDTGNWNNPQRGRIYSAEGCSPSLNTVGGGGLEPKILIDDTWSEKFGGTKTYRDYCPTLRSERYGLKVAVKEATKLGYAEATVGDSINIQFPDSKTRRGRVGKEVAQTLETSCNQAVLVPSNELKFIGGINDKDWVGDGKEFSRNYPQGNRVYDSEGIACSQTAQGGGIGSFTGLYATNYRIRKLTPKECWRLMGFSDEEFQKAQDAGVSNSQLYKQAGNSIVVDVLYYIFGNLNQNKEVGA